MVSAWERAGLRALAGAALLALLAAAALAAAALWYRPHLLSLFLVASLLFS